MNKKLILLDASSIATSSCMRKWKFTVLDGLVPDRVSWNMEAGTAFHKGLKAFYSKKDLQVCQQEAEDYLDKFPCPDDTHITSTYLSLALLAYVKKYQNDILKPLQLDGELLLEKTFKFPLYSDDNIEIVLVGTIDFIGELGGQLLIVDHKTTSSTYKNSFLAGFRLSPQLLTYDFVVRKILKLGEDISCMINAIFFWKAGAQFERSEIISFTKDLRDTYEEELRELCKKIACCYAANYWPVGCFTVCKEEYGPCRFQPICCVEPEYQQNVIDISYTKRLYNPLQFQKD